MSLSGMQNSRNPDIPDRETGTLPLTKSEERHPGSAVYSGNVAGQNGGRTIPETTDSVPRLLLSVRLRPPPAADTSADNTEYKPQQN
jgi:hypothetical protein